MDCIITMRAHYATAALILRALKHFACTSSCFTARRELFTPNNKNLLNFATHVTAHLSTAHVILRKILISMPRFQGTFNNTNRLIIHGHFFRLSHVFLLHCIGISDKPTVPS